MPNPSNWRKHPQGQREALRGLLSEIGIAGAGLAYYSERNGGKLTFIDGHLRDEEIPEGLPVLVTDLNDAEADLLLASYDPLSALAETGKQELDALLHSVATGDVALQKMLSGLAEGNGLEYGDGKKGLGPEPEPETNRAVELQAKYGTCLGQLWQIGKHRLLIGDSTDKTHVSQLCADKRPVLMVTDPPYGVEYDPEWREGSDLGIGQRSKGKVTNDDRIDWTEAYLLSGAPVCYVWHADRHASEVAANLKVAGFEIVCQVIWAKQHFALSRGDYHWQHEPCWYAVKKGSKHNWQGARDQSTLWNIKNNNSFGNAKKEETWGHGTQKPIECMARPIRNNTREGDEVYDPFLGSGTTMVAAEQLGRACYGLEIDEKYAAVILERMSQMGITPKLLST